MITNPSITSPTAGDNYAAVNDEVAFTCSTCTDQDKHTVGAQTYYPWDTVTYTWSASGGTFPYGNTGTSVTWRAPSTTGTYTVTVTVDDVNGHPPPGTGSDNDTSKQASRQMTVFDFTITDCPADWIPRGGGNANAVNFTAAVTAGGPSGTIDFFLSTVSEELGWCLNKGSQTDKDLKFDNGQQQKQYTNVTSQQTTVYCYDCGAYGWITATFTWEGGTVTAHVVGGSDNWVRIPKDAEQNCIADCWTYNTGGKDDDSDTSLNNAHNGDGLTRYEEYRGVDIDDDELVSDEERLNPNRKNLFVQGSGFGGDFPDFAYGNAFGEAQIDVHQFVGTVETDDRGIDVLVVTVSDTGDHIDRWASPSPSGVRCWISSTLGQSGVGDPNTYGGPVVYKKSVNYYFSDKPHSDEKTWTAAGQWTGDPNGVLDPANPERVEDTNDDGVLDNNEKDGAATAPTDDGDTAFDGDYPVKSGATWDWNQELSPKDIDNDGKVECPSDNEVPVDPGNEYTKEQVVRHATTHEMGHAVGITYPPNEWHCNDDTCLMFKETNNYKRDGHFCNDCRAKILIHNS